jgi:hypothetical protein
VCVQVVPPPIVFLQVLVDCTHIVVPHPPVRLYFRALYGVGDLLFGGVKIRPNRKHQLFWSILFWGWFVSVKLRV